MAKRWTNRSLLSFLRGEKAIVAVSLQLGYDRAYLTRALTSDPEGNPSAEFVERVMDALAVVTEGAPSA